MEGIHHILRNFRIPFTDVIRGIIVVLIIAKNEEDLIKNKGAKVITTLYTCDDFSDIQGQLFSQMWVQVEIRT